MLELASGLAAHCLGTVSDHGSLLISLFLTGLIGSVSHCAGMCGPLVGAQSLAVAARLAPGDATPLQRLTGSALLPYQVGRTVTYMTLGAVAAVPIDWGQRGVLISVLPALLLWAAAAIFFIQGLGRLGLVAMNTGSFTLPGAGIIAGSAQRLFASPVGWNGFGLGLLLGFLPCGLLYAALIVAAASGAPLAAAFGMLAFALGTFPLSWAIGYGSRLATQRFRARMKIPLALLLIFNAALLVALGLGML